MNAGSGCVRVVGAVVLVPVVCAGVVCVLDFVVFAGAVVAVVCDPCGALDTVTVFVCEPHAASASAHTQSAVESMPRRLFLIAAWYSPPVAALLARPADASADEPRACRPRASPTRVAAGASPSW